MGYSYIMPVKHIKGKTIELTTLFETMKVLVATEKPFAKVAVDGIREVVEAAGYELALLEKYTDKQQLLDAVADADALNILAANPELMELLPKNSILTPHPKEFERLFGKTDNSIERLERLAQKAGQYNVIIVLKGAHTAVADSHGYIYFNSTGNPGMATAGSGDVLTGVIAALLSQKYSPIEAARLGVYVHGMAGDIVAERIGVQGVIASDIIDALPLTFRKIAES